ncbi:competence protein ComK [Ornithinibacillus californiensis]|uniref:competence protein ComK n=1 Tax=Ornithinibacillus californiensis TaxID=161536 RepID=UPI00064E1186|nr:competence protein ComK [Ornithinibacillus californiensis]
MNYILPLYEINEQTLALIPVDHTDYQTIAIETDRTLYIKKTPFEIIKRGCLDNFSTFQGRRESITHLTGYKRKVPIPISVHRHIFVFPTHAYQDWNCCWIFYHHVESIVEEKPNSNQSLIVFKNGREVPVDVPRSELLKQMDRTNLIVSITRSFRS